MAKRVSAVAALGALLRGRRRLQRHGYVIGLGALTQITVTAYYATFAPARTGESVRAG